jgi:hypothetical protein
MASRGLHVLQHLHANSSWPRPLGNVQDCIYASHNCIWIMPSSIQTTNTQERTASTVCKYHSVSSTTRRVPEYAADQSCRKLPGTLPLIGNGIQFLKPRHELFNWFTSCERQHGLETLELSVPTLPPGVVINDPKNVEYVLKNEDLFTKGSFFRERSFDLFGMYDSSSFSSTGSMC